MNKETLKAAVAAEVDARYDSLRALSQQIHDHPELAFQEVMASGWLCDYLEEAGFTVERGICELPTSFCASYGKGTPVIAILAEYDALPKLGHACGHNVIAAGAVGAGVASRHVVDACGGSIRVIGTPAEELYGGKVLMAERGAFQDVDAAMMVHPGSTNRATNYFIACQTLEVEFFGKAAHAAARPHEGINALEAMLQSFAAINSLRQHIKDGSRIHGIITDGGEAPNIVPAHSAGVFIVRAWEDRYLDSLKERVLNCFIGAAKATGARLEYHWGEARYATMQNNIVIAHAFQGNLQSLGRKVLLQDPGGSFGSSDMGNVSHLLPGIHPTIAVAPPTTAIHTPEFAEAAGAESGVKGMIDAAKAMAMTVVDLLADNSLLLKAQDEFRKGKKTG